MTKPGLAALIAEASNEELAALKAALSTAPVTVTPTRPELDAAALKALRARHDAAAKRATEERPKLGLALQAALDARERAHAEVLRLGALIDGLDFEVGTVLDEIRSTAFAGRLHAVDDAIAELRAEADGLVLDTVIVSDRRFPGSKETVTNAETVDARRAALRRLAEDVERLAAQAAFTTPAELAAFVQAERKKLPAVESAADVKARILAA